MKETVEQYLARGGKIQRGLSPNLPKESSYRYVDPSITNPRYIKFKSDGTVNMLPELYMIPVRWK